MEDRNLVNVMVAMESQAISLIRLDQAQLLAAVREMSSRSYPEHTFGSVRILLLSGRNVDRIRESGKIATTPAVVASKHVFIYITTCGPDVVHVLREDMQCDFSRLSRRTPGPPVL